MTISSNNIYIKHWVNIVLMFVSVYRRIFFPSGTSCHSENIYGDKQKKHWGSVPIRYDEKYWGSVPIRYDEKHWGNIPTL